MFGTQHIDWQSTQRQCGSLVSMHFGLYIQRSISESFGISMQNVRPSTPNVRCRGPSAAANISL